MDHNRAMYPSRAHLILALGCALVAAHPAPGDEYPVEHGGSPEGSVQWADDEDDHDRAREARERGEILSLAEVSERARARFPGRILEAELEREGGRWVYELKILDPAGRLREVYVDAQNGSLLDHEEDH